MSDRPQKAWHPDVRYITFSFADGRITVFKSALEDLHWPAFYRFLYNSSEKQFAIQACKEEAPGSHRSPRLKLGDSCEIKSKALVRLLYRDGRWEIAHSYRVPGRIVTEQNLIEFDLRQAIQLEHCCCGEECRVTLRRATALKCCAQNEKKEPAQGIKRH